MIGREWGRWDIEEEGVGVVGKEVVGIREVGGDLWYWKGSLRVRVM